METMLTVFFFENASAKALGDAIAEEQRKHMMEVMRRVDTRLRGAVPSQSFNDGISDGM